jgi:DNA-binding NtrC family response regulator
MAIILVADHLSERRNILCTFLRGDEHVLIPASRDEEALKLLRQNRPDLLIAEGTVTGAKLLTEGRQLDPSVAIILIMTSPPTVDQLVELMNQGVSDVLVSPLDINDVKSKVERALSARSAPGAVQIRFTEMVGSSQRMQEVFRKVVKAAATDGPVLILGETGSGKQSTARQIHDLSSGKDRSLKIVHCQVLSPLELESELFGHEPGVAAWAVDRRRGVLESGEGVTVYLEEVGALAPGTQVKLLRFLEEQIVQRVGGDQALRADVRLLASASTPLFQNVQDGGFRADLYYRLSAHLIEMPPLRGRAADIPDLVDFFLSRFHVQIGGEAIEILMNYSWPGNVDELRNALEQAVNVCDGNRIELKDLPPRVLKAVAKGDRRHKFVPRPKEPKQ